jgi:hypothetical protein
VSSTSVLAEPAADPHALLSQRNRGAAARNRLCTIGSFRDCSTAAARAKAAELKRRVDDGRDPVSERRATLPKQGRLRGKSVRRPEIEAFHRDVSKATLVRAYRALSLLRKMFNLAIGWEIRSDNPCRGIERNHENKRDRYLTPAELERLMVAIASHPNQASANVLSDGAPVPCRRRETSTHDSAVSERRTANRPYRRRSAHRHGLRSHRQRADPRPRQPGRSRKPAVTPTSTAE